MGNTRAIACQVLRAKDGFAIVKSWCKKVDEFGMAYGGTQVFYDVCEFKDGEFGDTFDSFKTLNKAVRYLNEIGGLR